MKVELTLIEIDDEHATVNDELGREHIFPLYQFDGVPKLWKPGQMLICNLTEAEIEANDVFV